MEHPPQIDFDPIRPFYDEEVQPAIGRLLEEPEFQAALSTVFPGVPFETVRQQLLAIRSVDDFQGKIISAVVRFIVEKTTAGMELSGTDHIPHDRACLIISNHRDIVLDSALLNYGLFCAGIPTTRIAIGNNLLQRPWIEDLVKLNKNFIVHRNVQARQAYEYTLRLSAYIRHSLLEEKQSVWIAQREGRTKNGDDRTQPGLLKMFGISAEKEGAEAYIRMSILPLSISYELEPCAGLKALEQYTRDTNGLYEKRPGEDLISMKQGMLSPKGRVQLSFGRVIDPILIREIFTGRNRNEAVKLLAEEIDSQIIEQYRLFPSHYYAFDQLSGTEANKQAYTADDVAAFERFIREQLLLAGANDLHDVLRRYILEIYATPLRRKQEVEIKQGKERTV